MGHAALRRGRWSQPGQLYLVTFATADRRPLFLAGAHAFAACRAMTAPALWSHSKLLAWVLMPDHWHGLVALGEADTLPACVRRLKGRSARELARAHPQLRPVWARAYHDRALRAEDDVRAAARYVVANPVRAGLVRRVGDYPFWDSVWVGGNGARGERGRG
ncbi:MAG TPA: transposase [Lysobacter sp.]|nr:transposase [Lysobacter sp.]